MWLLLFFGNGVETLEPRGGAHFREVTRAPTGLCRRGL